MTESPKNSAKGPQLDNLGEHAWWSNIGRWPKADDDGDEKEEDEDNCDDEEEEEEEGYDDDDDEQQ